MLVFKHQRLIRKVISHPRLLHASDLVKMRLDKAQEFLDLLLLDDLWIVAYVDVAMLEILVDDSFHHWIVFRQQVHPVAPVFHLLCVIAISFKISSMLSIWSHLLKHEICVASRANVLIHVVPVEVLKLFCREIDPGDLVSIMIWRVKSITIIDIDWCVRMSRTVARHFDLRAC